MGGVLITGGTGFVGSALVKRMGRRAQTLSTRADADTWTTALQGVECVVHLAARVHQVDDAAVHPLAEFRRINVEDTLNLARRAALAGVRRFVFISSIKVNGESTRQGQPFTAADSPRPVDAYGVSKHEAECGLHELSAQSSMEMVIIRPPLVYGPGVKANFATMVRWLQRGVPLPLGAIHNARSLVALDNLVDLIFICIDHPAAANQTFLVSDGEDVSTPELLRRMASTMGKRARLVPVPQWILETGARLLGQPDLAQRLCGSLQLDISKTRELLGWAPPLSLDEGLGRVMLVNGETYVD